jgi:hypothetical protein
MRVLVRSRIGNLLLAFVGAVYALTALGVLAWFSIDVQDGAAFVDLLLQVALLAAAACGVWFVLIALPSLRQGTGGISNAASIQR